MNFVQLDITAIKQSDSQNNAYVLLLNEADGERQLPIVIGWCEARSIAIALEDNEKLERPLTHDLFKTLGDNFNIIVEKIVIHTLIEGIFHSSFYCKNGITNEIVAIDSRTSDAIAIAIRYGCPIYTYEDILSRAGIILTSGSSEDTDYTELNLNEEEDKSANPKDLRNFNLNKLQKMLSIAIQEEDYEQASEIRDEINTRKSK